MYGVTRDNAVDRVTPELYVNLPAPVSLFLDESMEHP